MPKPKALLTIAARSPHYQLGHPTMANSSFSLIRIARGEEIARNASGRVVVASRLPNGVPASPLSGVFPIPFLTVFRFETVGGKACVP
jgi:hypothetical protein